MGSAPQRLGRSWLQQELRGGWGAQPVCQCDCNGSGEGGGPPCLLPLQALPFSSGVPVLHPMASSSPAPTGQGCGWTVPWGGKGRAGEGFVVYFFLMKSVNTEK